MKMSNGIVFGAGSLLALAIVVVLLQQHQVEAASELMSRENNDQLPQTDSELNRLENIKRHQQQANFVRKQQFNNNGQDVAALGQYPLRQQQQLKSAYPLSNQVGQFPVQQLQFEDEHAMRRQLPDLIAQAHTDKSLERALLKMLINASLRSTLTGAASSGATYGYRGQDGGETGNTFLGGEVAPVHMSARLEQVIDDLAGIDPLIANDVSGQAPYQQEPQYPQVIGKREYVKPCFFNAVACAKNPFRETS